MSQRHRIRGMDCAEEIAILGRTEEPGWPAPTRQPFPR